MTNEARELNFAELDEVSGGGIVDFGLGLVVNAAYDYMKDHHGISDSINYIKQQAGK
jgi:hypothetical protein